jgi:TP901 family phage tail tape measure protein
MQILAVSARAAIAGVTDTKTATSALISVLNSYTMQASEVNHVNDVMFQTVRYGIVQYNDLARYIGNVAPIAASAGVTFEEVSASLASITKAGLNASKATIGLRGAILKLLNNTEKGTETLANYGIEVTAASLAEKGLIATMREINTAIGGNTDVWAKIISDNRALTATLALMRNNGEEAVDFLHKMNDASRGAGAGTEAYLTVAQSFDHTMAQLRAEWSRFIILLGEQYLPVITMVAESTQQFLHTLNGLPDPLKNSAAMLLGLVAAGAGINAIVNTIKLAREGLIAYRVEVAQTLAQVKAAEAASGLSGGAAAAAKGVSSQASGAVAAGATEAAAAAATAVGGAIDNAAEKAKNVVYAADLPDVPAIPVNDVLPDPDRMAARAAAQAAASMDDTVIAGSKQLSSLAAKNADDVAALASLVGALPEGSADAAKGVAEVGEIVSDELKKSVSAVAGLSAELANIPDGASDVVDAAKSMSGEFAKAAASQVDDVEALLGVLKDIPDDARLAAIESSEALQGALKNQRDQVNKLFVEVSNFAALAPEGATLIGDPALLDQASKSIEDANRAAVDFSKSIDKLPASAGSSKGALVSMSAGVEAAVKKNSDSVGEIVEVLAGGFGDVSAKEAEFLQDLVQQADKTGDRIVACGADVSGLADLISELPDETAKATKAAKEMADEIGKAAAKNADDIAVLSKNLSEMPGLARDAKAAAIRTEADALLKGGKAAAGG